MFGLKVVKSDVGFSVTCGERVVFRWIRYGKLLCRTYAMLKFQADREDLLQQGCRLPPEAAPRWTGRYYVDVVRLGDLRRPRFRQLGGGSLPLAETMLVRYLQTKDERILDEYERLHVKFGIFEQGKMKEWRASALRTFDSIGRDGYDPLKSCIVIKENNDIADGYHRSAALYVRHGPDFEIRVIRILGDVRKEGLF